MARARIQLVINSATYSYLANSPLVSQITFKQSGTTRMTTTKQYDDLNRLTQISSQPGATGVPPATFNYNYNSANQRTQDKLADGSYWVYNYDSLGQVTGGHKYFSDGTPVPGQQFDYGFDTIGNRTQTKAGGDQTGGNQRLANYSANSLNQITSRDYPGTNDVVGAALATNSVTVNGQTAWRKGEYFWGVVKTNNAVSPNWVNVTVASGGNSNSGSLYFPQTPEHFSYDPDGNLTNDGRWAYVWDAENRLISMTVNTNVGPQYQLVFAYDAKGKRIQKLVSIWNPFTLNYQPLTTNSFLYDGWNLIATLNPQSPVGQYFVWGSDLSGSLQGAGGVGGLVEMGCTGSATTNCLPAFDGNGNVVALVNAADGTSLANYEYGPFGEVIRSTGPMAKVNPFQFSTKYQDDESDLLYYGFRYYKPLTGTWLNQDPIEEQGGLNLYGFARNCPISNLDGLGLVIVGFYGADISFRWPNAGNVWLEEMSDMLAVNETVLRPRAGARPSRLYESRDIDTAFDDLLSYLDTNQDGVYSSCDNQEPIKIFGWSWGGYSAIKLAKKILDSPKFLSKKVDLVAVIDPVPFGRIGTRKVSPNVLNFWNRYETKGQGVTILGIPVHGRKFGDIPNQKDMNPDGLQTINIGGDVYSVNHITIIWEVESDFLAQFQ